MTTRHTLEALKRSLGLPAVALTCEIATARSVEITLQELEASKTQPSIRAAILERTRLEAPAAFDVWEAGQYRLT